jgi:Lar family restriction alleviation protein
MSKLIINPCPFCGSDDTSLKLLEDPEVAVVCYHCLATGPVAGNDETAAEMWNERADGTDAD